MRHRGKTTPPFGFASPIQPSNTAEFGPYVANLGGARREEYEALREGGGFQQEAIFLQQTPLDEMVVIVQDADSRQHGLNALKAMTDPAHDWFFQRMKDLNGVDVLGSGIPANEVLLDDRADHQLNELA
ncbi:MAG: hypothetical protein WAK40_01070 [Thermoplasmata archaeon]